MDYRLLEKNKSRMHASFLELSRGGKQKFLMWPYNEISHQTDRVTQILSDHTEILSNQA